MPCLKGLSRARRAAPALAAIALLAPAGGAFAVTRFQRSAYTAFALADCTAIKPASGGAAFMCPGLPGYPIFIAQADGRTFFSAGPEPQGTKAATQSLGAFNTPFARSTKRATVEWRFVIRDGRKEPYATIVRYYTSLNRSRGQVLVVTRIAGGEACQAAHVDASANDQPIVLARRFADEAGRAFECTSPPRVLGETGHSPM